MVENLSLSRHVQLMSDEMNKIRHMNYEEYHSPTQKITLYAFTELYPRIPVI